MNEEDYKKIVRLAFDQASVGYDSPAMRFFDYGAARLVERLPLCGSERVLDVATGTGKIALRAAKRLPAGRVTAVDLSEGMLARAQHKANLENIPNVAFHCMDAANADFPDGYFDGLCCGFGVFFWTDMEGTLKRLLRMVKPGGFAAMTSFAGGSFKPLSDLCLNRFQLYGVKLPQTYTWERLDHPQKHERLLTEVGLKDVKSEVRPVGYFLENAAQWWDVVYYSGFRGFLNQLSPERAERYKAEHLKEVSEKAVDLGIYLNVDVIVTLAQK